MNQGGKAAFAKAWRIRHDCVRAQIEASLKLETQRLDRRANAGVVVFRRPAGGADGGDYFSRLVAHQHAAGQGNDLAAGHRVQCIDKALLDTALAITLREFIGIRGHRQRAPGLGLGNPHAQEIETRVTAEGGTER